jgi:hypothetical protein
VKTSIIAENVTAGKLSIGPDAPCQMIRENGCDVFAQGRRHARTYRSKAMTSLRTSIRPAALTTNSPLPVVPKEAVNQVDADRMKAVGTRRVHHAPRHLERLDAIDRPLHDRIEILHAGLRSHAAQWHNAGSGARRWLSDACSYEV